MDSAASRPENERELLYLLAEREELLALERAVREWEPAMMEAALARLDEVRRG